MFDSDPGLQTHSGIPGVDLIAVVLDVQIQYADKKALCWDAWIVYNGTTGIRYLCVRV